MLFRKYIYRRKTPFDKKAVYLSIMATVYIWTIIVFMEVFGTDLGFVAGMIGGAVLVKLLDNAIGFMNNAGY